MNDDARVELDREVGLALRTLLRAGRELTATLARRLDLGVTDVQAMDHLVSAEGTPGPAQLAHVLGIRSASATVLVDRLESAGHLRRARSSVDRRRVTLEVTESAQHEVRAAMMPLLARLAEITSALDADEAEVVRRFLHDATACIQDFTRADPSD